MPFILPDALTEDRKWRCSVINCLGVHFIVGLNLDVPWSEVLCGVFE